VLAARSTHEGVQLRRADSTEPLPAGWRTHPAGTLDGVHLDFAYRPGRHDICRAIGTPSVHLAAGLRQAGYQRSARLDGGIELWVRDRPASVRARLAGLTVVDGGRVRQR
jgi:hypothetical protein